MNRFYFSIFLGSLVAFSGIHQIITGEVQFHRGHPIPLWAGFIQVPIGCWIIFIAIRAILRGEGKGSHRYTKKEIAKAKEDLEAMVTRDLGKCHHEIPKTKGLEQPEPKVSALQTWEESLNDACKSKITAKKYLRNAKVRLGLLLMGIGMVGGLCTAFGLDWFIVDIFAGSMVIAGMLTLAVGTVEVL